MNRIFSESGSLPSYRRSFTFSKNDGAHLLSSRHDPRKAGEHGDVSLPVAKATQSIGNQFSNDGPHFCPQKWSFRLFFQNRIRGFMIPSGPLINDGSQTRVEVWQEHEARLFQVD